MISVAWGVLLGLVVSHVAGCGAVVDAAASGDGVASESSAVANDESTASRSIDAGVVFADQANYLCIPLSRLGISTGDEVLEVRSSCDCTQPSIVAYHVTTTKSERALRIDFEPESTVPESTVPGSTMPGSQAAPASLAVEVTLDLAGGRSTSATIQFLHTHLAAAGINQGANP